MTIRSLGMPWASPGDRTFSLPRDVLVTLALGEDPSDVPALIDVRDGQVKAAEKLDGGPVDRIVGELAGAFRAVRVHSAAAALASPSRRNRGYDAAEQASGLARSFLLRVPKGAPVGRIAETLAQLSTVTSASPNYVAVTPFEAPARPGQFAGARSEDPAAPRTLIRAPEALRREPGDPAVLIGLVDSGVALNHPEIAGKLRAGYDTVQMADDGVSPGIQLLGDHGKFDRNPTDRFVGHGMGCAGIIGGLGLRMPPGLAGLAQIIPLRALAAARLPGKDNAIGIGAISDLDAAVKLAVDLGAKVINMSFGTDDDALAPSSPKPHTDVVRYALNRGCILIAASGNNGRETRYWPAAFEGVIAVGACDDDRHVTGFSTRGEHVALCAPGQNVLSCGLTGYQHVTGTSFAAPFVAAAAALLVARGQRRACPVDGALVRSVLTASAQPFAETPPAGCGSGILDVVAALERLDVVIDQTVADDPGQIEDG
ncbi:S8 family peptidase [Glacieibacterium sp.]|uniref:S8 family peptidase n=1 Tax=Glacieibacterium sp. TaxID=2860237 RepID=UPI003B00847E